MYIMYKICELALNYNNFTFILLYRVALFCQTEGSQLHSLELHTPTHIHTGHHQPKSSPAGQLRCKLPTIM